MSGALDQLTQALADRYRIERELVRAASLYVAEGVL